MNERTGESGGRGGGERRGKDEDEERGIMAHSQRPAQLGRYAIQLNSTTVDLVSRAVFRPSTTRLSRPATNEERHGGARVSWPFDHHCQPQQRAEDRVLLPFFTAPRCHTHTRRPVFFPNPHLSLGPCQIAICCCVGCVSLERVLWGSGLFIIACFVARSCFPPLGTPCIVIYVLIHIHVTILVEIAVCLPDRGQSCCHRA